MNIEHLYRQVIMEHYKNPKNKGFVADNSYMTVHLNNPSCGDEMTVQLKVDNHKIIDILHQGTGCSICCSSASVMSETLKNKSLDEAISILHEFYELIKGYPFNPEILKGDAVVYQGVAQFPARVKCATLAWKAAEQGIIKIKEDELNG
ncbi:Fe-S cluster assembly sulfur transfer protein SufU [Peloplasma aerotolerans]|uniref:SUF system NifU family Fe-S cluster assembly protein n=1 Tax=Peloplasma aerotolerans TaxID=3044389 RepID=A0AAW6U4Y5_9MOLU|nr:SUF system NifU family Fe-S cluster assembly protein [Mariniplasma sp. M4Ah]MDI6452947.1 SUF system NifU family Fe-S cluster assembly protein [Mariniplasma sp. M4Ah]